jgi:chromosome segregation ATPase
LLDNEQRVHDLKVQLTTVQGHHKESMDQLGEKSRQVAALKTDLAKGQQQNQSMNDEVGSDLLQILICYF